MTVYLNEAGTLVKKGIRESPLKQGKIRCFHKNSSVVSSCQHQRRAGSVQPSPASVISTETERRTLQWGRRGRRLELGWSTYFWLWRKV